MPRPSQQAPFHTNEQQFYLWLKEGKSPPEKKTFQSTLPRIQISHYKIPSFLNKTLKYLNSSTPYLGLTIHRFPFRNQGYRGADPHPSYITLIAVNRTVNIAGHGPMMLSLSLSSHILCLQHYFQLPCNVEEAFCYHGVV